MRTSLFTTVFCRFLYGQKVVVGGRIIVWFLSLLKKMANSFFCNWRGAVVSDKYPNYSTFDKLQTRKADFRWNSILLKSTGKNLVSWVLAKITHDIHICTQFANGYRLRVRIQANQTFEHNQVFCRSVIIFFIVLPRDIISWILIWTSMWSLSWKDVTCNKKVTSCGSYGYKSS